MASFSIRKRQLKSGELRFTVDIIVKNNSGIIHRESKTFRKKEFARTFALKRVNELENPKAPVKSVPIYKLLDMYMNDRDLWDNTGRTKQYVIRMLRDCDISLIDCNHLKSSDIIQHCRNRKATGTQPVTIYHDVAYLRSVVKKAKPVFNITANTEIFEETIPVLIDMKLIGKSQKRTRRPTNDELEKLKEGLKERQNYRPNGQIRIPFLDILDFSILTCMRIGEVCKLQWDDLNIEHKTVLVRDRKDPRKKTGNHMVVPLLGESFDIVMRQPKESSLIFPYNSRSVSAGFQRVRNSLGITDLRYHDLRREGASRLFEKGYSIEEVAQVTGHRSLNVLWQVYTQLYPYNLHNKS
ncbi:site-specific integrase [Photobacterium damselae]|uniref:site-specific integrase n=1 Tax=Photobacterium damselae TaxID=38293 RepID=UPI000D06789F|nr:site-specific integrase [Photobacterium damselae]PSB82991.1 site-specific integrase [Photobacterium damselae subsp. damselae]